MKLALVFMLLALLASCTFQQQQSKYKWMLPVLSPIYAPKTFLFESDEWTDPSAGADEMDVKDWSLVQPRRAVEDRLVNNVPGQRFFGALRPFANGGGFNPWYLNTVVTTTTIWSTVLSATITTCIPSAQFVAAALNAGLNTCNRKKRFAVEPAMSLAPTSAQTVVATEAPPPPSIREDGNPLSSSPHEISPSIEEEPTDRSKFHSARTARAFSNNFIVTLVSTVTNYVFNTTFIRKTITPAIANAQLSCLPPGMTVC